MSEAKSGKKQVDSHNEINIFSLRKMLEDYFSFQGIEADKYRRRFSDRKPGAREKSFTSL